jgi:hypothetical protein
MNCHSYMMMMTEEEDVWFYIVLTLKVPLNDIQNEYDIGFLIRLRNFNIV